MAVRVRGRYRSGGRNGGPKKKNKNATSSRVERRFVDIDKLVLYGYINRYSQMPESELKALKRTKIGVLEKAVITVLLNTVNERTSVQSQVIALDFVLDRLVGKVPLIANHQVAFSNPYMSKSSEELDQLRKSLNEEIARTTALYENPPPYLQKVIEAERALKARDVTTEQHSSDAKGISETRDDSERPLETPSDQSRLVS